MLQTVPIFKPNKIQNVQFCAKIEMKIANNRTQLNI